MERRRVCALLLCLAVVVPACSEDGDGDGGGGGGGSAAVFFTADNAVGAGGLLAAVIEPLAAASLAALAAVEATEDAAAGGKTALDLTDLGELGLCASGQSTGTWDDRDGNVAVSAGDVVTVTLTDCDGVTAATLTMVLDDVGYAYTSATVALEATIEEIVGGSPETTVLTGAFRAEMNRVPDPPTFISRLVVDDQADAAQGFTVATDGATALDLGCFNLYFTFNRTTGAFTLSEPLAVFRTAAGYFSLVAWGLPPLLFPDGVTPTAGQVRFVAQSVATPCTAIGVPGDGIDSNDSFLVLTVSAGGGVTIAGETDGGTAISVTSSWDEMY